MAVSQDTLNTFVLVAVTGILAISLMAARLCLRRIRGQSFNLSDYLTMLAIFCIVLRSALTTVVELWGNNNMTEAFRATHVFTAEEIYHREIGGKLTLVNRSVYNSYIWIQKGVVLLLYHRLLADLPWPERIMKVYWVILFLTIVGVQISCFVECRPFHLYWQVVPDPGTCTQAVIQLYVLVPANIATDIMLIVLPMPYLLRVRRSLAKKLQLTGLFSMGLALVIIAICRLPVYSAGTTQVNRNTIGSVEAFFAAFVANVPTLVTLRKAQPPAANPTAVSAPGLVTIGQKSSRGLHGMGMGNDRDGFRQIPSRDNGNGETLDFEMAAFDSEIPAERGTEKHEAYVHN